MSPFVHVDRPDNRFEYETNQPNEQSFERKSQAALSIDRANREMLAFHGQQHRAARLTGIAPTREGVPPECLAIIRLMEGNDTCMDRNPSCHQGGLPEYAAVEFGILLCRRCGFRHLDRNREGVTVKNLQFDQWKFSEVLTLLDGGNGSYERYYNTQSPRNQFRRKDDNVTNPEQLLDRRYGGKLSSTYKQQLVEKVRKTYSDRENLIQLHFLSQRGGQRRGRHDFESLNESCHSHSSMSEASTSDRSNVRSVKFGYAPENNLQREINSGMSPHNITGKARLRANYVDPQTRTSSMISPSTTGSETMSRVQLMQLASNNQRSSSSLASNGGGDLTTFSNLRSVRDLGEKPASTRRAAATAAFAQYQRLTGK